MTKDHCLFIGRTATLPPEQNGESHEIIYCLDGFVKNKNNIEDDVELEYLITILYKTAEYVNAEKEYIKVEWQELTGGEISVELIETKRNKLSRVLRDIFDSNQDNEVLFKPPFVCFMKSSQDGHTKAYALLKNTFLKPAWMFWR